MRKIWLVARFTMREAARRKALLVLLLAAVVVVGGFGFTLHKVWTEHAPRMSATQAQAMVWTAMRLVMGLLNVLVSIAAVFVGASGISGEMDSGSLHVLLPRTVTRMQVFLGKLLAVTLLVAAFSTVITLGMGVDCLLLGPGWPPGWHWVIVGFMVPPLMLAALALLLSTRLPTLAAGLISLMLFVAAQVGSVLEMVAAQMQSSSLNVTGIVISLLAPIDAMYRWMLHQWANAMGPAAAIFRVVDGVNAPPPSQWMVVWSASWMLMVVLVGVQSFRTRDL